MDDKRLISFEQAVQACFENQEFMQNYNRLRGTNLSLQTSSPFEQAIDQACGVETFNSQEVYEFFDFVRDYVWIPVNKKIRAESEKYNI